MTQTNDLLYWENLNRAKESVALDLRRREGREPLQRLISSVGQFITNFPADGLLSHDILAETRDYLVTVRVMGWPDGSPALDYTVNNAVGYPLMTGTGDKPVNHVLPAWDLLAGSYAAFALMALLRRRSVTGLGGEIRVPLSDVAIGTAANLGNIAEVLYNGRDRERLGNAVYGLFGRDFVTADGVRTMIVVVTPRQWGNLLTALDIVSDVARIKAECGVSFAKDDGTRFANRDALFPLFERAISSLAHANLTHALETGGVVHSAYRIIREAARDPVLYASNPVFGQSENPSGFAYPAAGAFATVPQLERDAPRPAPRNGQYSEHVLATMLNLPSGEIARLVDAGIVGVA